jgi:hypothetical protein
VHVPPLQVHGGGGAGDIAAGGGLTAFRFFFFLFFLASAWSRFSCLAAVCLRFLCFLLAAVSLG